MLRLNLDRKIVKTRLHKLPVVSPFVSAFVMKEDAAGLDIFLLLPIKIHHSLYNKVSFFAFFLKTDKYYINETNYFISVVNHGYFHDWRMPS